MNAALNRILDAIIGALDLFRPWVVLDEYERGVMLRVGKFHRELGPGPHLRWPMRYEVLKFVNVRKKAGDPWEMTNTTRDGTAVTAGFAWCIAVKDAKYVLLNLDNWDQVAYKIMNIAIASVIHKSSATEFFSETFITDCETAASSVLENNGLELREFGITQRAATPAYRLFKGAN